VVKRVKEVWRCFGINGSAVSEVMTGINGRLDKEAKLRREIVYLRGK
jgi:hypothetical protein